MAKLAADLEGMSMMREPKPMPIIYRQEGGDTYGEETADISGSFDDGPSDGGANEGGGDDGTYTADQMADLVSTLGPDVAPDSGPVGEGPMSDEQADLLAAVYGLAPGTLGPQGVGTGGPGEFDGFGVGRSGDTIDALNRSFNKKGIPEEFVPYYNSLKDRGLTNEQAMATLAAVAGTPGGAASLTSGYTDGYSYGGPMGTLEDLIETGQTASLEQRAKKARKEAKEKDEEGVAPASLADYEEPGVMDRFASILGLDDFSLASLNPFTVTPEQQAIMQSYRDQGLTVQQRSDMDNLIGLGIGAALPIQLSGPKFIAEQATDTGIFALATDPATGFEYLIDNSGGLQLAPGQLGDESNQDGGNEPVITAKRKATTEKPKEEKKKEASKESFPQQKLPRFTPSDQTTIANIYGSDAPILDKYTTGIQALV